MQPPTAIAGINFSLGDSESADKGILMFVSIRVIIQIEQV